MAGAAGTMLGLPWGSWWAQSQGFTILSPGKGSLTEACSPTISLPGSLLTLLVGLALREVIWVALCPLSQRDAGFLTPSMCQNVTLLENRVLTEVIKFKCDHDGGL